MFASNTSQVSSDATYIEDVFSTWLYNGTGATQTINNGIDLAGKGGMTWFKWRTSDTFGLNHALFDTDRGVGNFLSSNNTAASTFQSLSLTSFNSNGFSLGQDGGDNVNRPSTTYASWTFRKQPKFFDVVTYTGDGTTNRTIAHSLGSVPGCIVVKATSTTGAWFVYHRSLPVDPTFGPYRLQLNSTAAQVSNDEWGTAPTSTVFTVNNGNVNGSGVTYVAYVFAHNAGGFGLTGTDNVISCGSYTGNGSTSGPVVTLGYEPQWVLIKDATNGSPDWWLFDSMRGVATGSVDMGLRPNTTGAEVTTNDYLSFTATGFQPTATTNTVNQSGDNYIYIAIRRGPMKTPTTGTSVFAVNYQGQLAGKYGYVSNFPVDAALRKFTTGSSGFMQSRLTGTWYLKTDTTDSEASFTQNVFDDNKSWWNITTSDSTRYSWMFRRAPGFFDVVCYAGTGVNESIPHNLAVAPELYIVKRRDTAGSGWVVGSTQIAATQILQLNAINGVSNGTQFQNSYPTASNLLVSNQASINASGATYVAYLFASCPGVSKVGSYTGTGASRTINCGFTSGARFVLIKRTDSTSSWYFWDTSRGMSSSTDPYLFLNNIDAQVTGTNWIDTASTGFSFTGAADDEVNLLNASYIYLAIA